MTALRYLIFFASFCFIYASICTDDAVKSQGLLGGWKEHDASGLEKELEAKVSTYIAQAIEKWNAQTNDLRKLRMVSEEEGGSPHITSIFTQVVAGTNYCVKFVAEPYGCKNDINEVSCTSGEYECEMKAFEPPPYMVQGALLEDSVQDVKCEAVEEFEKGGD